MIKLKWTDTPKRVITCQRYNDNIETKLEN